MDDLTLEIDTGAPVEVPAFEPDECGHNWLAVIEDRDPRAPGGLRRRFQPRAGVPFYYLVEGLKVGDVIEFGADRVSLKPSGQRVGALFKQTHCDKEISIGRTAATLPRHGVRIERREDSLQIRAVDPQNAGL